MVRISIGLLKLFCLVNSYNTLPQQRNRGRKKSSVAETCHTTLT